MKVLVIGSGGREHALVWKLKQSPKVDKIYTAPGNGGIAKEAECIDIKVDNITALLDFAKKNEIGLTIVGPEVPLAEGIVDKFNKAGLKAFGPVKELAQLESSKAYAKQVMSRFNIPTADYRIFDDAEEAKNYILCRGLINQTPTFPLVVKADGLAAGKGVVICKSSKEALAAIEDMMVKKIFGPAGERVIIEECLGGEEASILVVCDGKNVAPLASSQDHKRVFDEDLGPNTGGMGAYSPAPVIDENMNKRVMSEIVMPLINGLCKEGKFYKGVLYAGIMVAKTGPKVLEFNVRFGDPETQAILPRLKTDLVDLCFASIDGTIDKIKLEWHNKVSICVVIASGGYPGEFKKGFEISGLEDAIGSGKEVYIFHAGTKLQNDKIVTSGGRVLNVVSMGDNIKQAIDNVYKAVSKIKFEGMHYRKDIGYRALKRGELCQNRKSQ